MRANEAAIEQRTKPEIGYAAKQHDETVDILLARYGEKTGNELARAEQLRPIGELLRDTGATAAVNAGGKIRIAGEQLVGALAGHDGLYMGAHRPPQKEFGSTVGIDDRNLAMPNRI